MAEMTPEQKPGKYVLPEGMTPDELERIAGVLRIRGERCGDIPLRSIQQLQKWAEEIRVVAQ